MRVRRVLHTLLPVLICLLPLIALRLWQLSERFYFGVDEEYQALLALEQIKDLHPIWIGTSQANTGFYLGPGLVYLHAFILKLSQLDPIGLALAASVTAILTLVVLYSVSKQLFGERVALLALLLYGFSAFALYWDRRFWSPTLVPLLTLLIFFALSTLPKRPESYALLGLALGASLHVHASLFAFFPFALYQAVRSLHPKRWKWVSLGVGIFLAFYSPLFIYDLNSNFNNWRASLRLWESGESSVISLALALLLIIVLVMSQKIIRSAKMRVLTGLVCSFLLFLTLVAHPFHSYYLLGLSPLMALMAALYLRHLPKWLLALLALPYIFFNVRHFYFTPTPGNLAEKKSVVRAAQALLKGRSYALITPVPYLKHAGWQYLFTTQLYPPQRSTADGTFGWIYGSAPISSSPDVHLEVTLSGAKLLK